MKKTLILTSIYILFSVSVSYAQDDVCSKTDSVIFSAMQDEMDRSMVDYEHSKAGRFFYIMYQIDDGESFVTEASLGGLLKSHKNKFRDKSYRIMLGDYNFNDENFIRSSRDYSNFSKLNNIQVPLNDDYYGIRRALWSHTNIAYERCLKSYLDKKAFFEKNPDLKPSIPDYTKIDSIRFIKNTNIDLLDKLKAETLVKDISKVFIDYNKVVESLVSFNQTIINVYLLSTEGAMVKIPLNYSLLSVKISVLKDSITNRKQTKSLSYYEINPENFIIKTNKIKKDANKLANYISEIIDAEELDEEYEGPVLLSDRAVSNFFYNAMFGKDINLIAEREQISENVRQNFPRNNNKKFEEKIGQLIIPSSFSVTDRPKLTEYKNKNLLGTTFIDQECVIPPEELNLIKDGKLLTLFNDRIPKPSLTKSNGHYRLGVSAGSSTRQVAPSNLFFEYSKGEDLKNVDASFYELCKKEELDFGILIKSLIPDADYSPLVYYKVFNDGKQVLIKNLSFPSSKRKSLKKIVTCTKEQYVSNKLIGAGSFFNFRYGFGGLSGIFSGMVTPSKILIKDIDLEEGNDFNNLFD